MAEEEVWGTWDCPHEGCDEVGINDPDSIRVTSCGNGHPSLLGPVTEGGYRWAEVHVPTKDDQRIAKLIYGRKLSRKKSA